MHAMLTAPLSRRDVDLCEDCAGTLRYPDRDGSVCGTAGAMVPCGCTDALLGVRGLCPCHLPVWPENGGFTGWVRIPLEDFDDDSPFLRPCPVHATVALPGTGVAA
ncbi:hypothetical protein [Streptomyces sp. NPDC001380]|uniref:hypothetical protein n=1 Tax=Streptomyces sp. NPDC001380 TaxID=3364566 RepID=UPI0036B33852